VRVLNGRRVLEGILFDGQRMLAAHQKPSEVYSVTLRRMKKLQDLKWCKIDWG
jgi:hypothetical protein